MMKANNEDTIKNAAEQPETAQPQTEAKDETVQNEGTEAQGEEEELVAELDPLAKLEEENASLKDKYLRKMAEFENYRKRTVKEKAELILNGGKKTITNLLPILDDFERAQANMAKTDDVAALREGVDLIFKKLMKTLEGEGLKVIDTKEQEFNTDFHEAIAMIPAPVDDLKGKVVDCVQTGYMLNDEVIRHAKVAVGQ